MDSNALDESKPAPIDSKDIRAKLAELDRKLAAWSTVVTTTRPGCEDPPLAPVTCAAQPPVEPPYFGEIRAAEPPTITEVPAAVVAMTIPAVDAPKETCESEPIIAQSPEPVATQSPEPLVAESAEAVTVEPAELVMAQSTEPAMAESPEPAVVTPPVQPENEELLLASLEPDVANAIRVRRRMSSYRVNVRELVNEYQLRLGRGTTTDSKGSKAWFAWGRA